jgi:hypothetical protein
MYIVHMKRVTPTQARRNWFRLLDEVSRGEVVVLERNGRRIVLRLEEIPEQEEGEVPAYGDLLSVPEADRADEWGWEWEAPGRDLGMVAEGPEEDGG